MKRQGMRPATTAAKMVGLAEEKARAIEDAATTKAIKMATAYPCQGKEKEEGGKEVKEVEEEGKRFRANNKGKQQQRWSNGAYQDAPALLLCGVLGLITYGWTDQCECAGALLLVALQEADAPWTAGCGSRT